jgi:hypothetical protein
MTIRSARRSLEVLGFLGFFEESKILAMVQVTGAFAL